MIFSVMRNMKDIYAKKRKTGIWVQAAVILLVGCTTTPPAEAEIEDQVSQSSYIQAYYEFLQSCITNSDYPAEKVRLRFGMAYIDADDKPELLLFRDDSHAAGVEVYTYVQDQVAQTGTFGSFGSMQYVEQKGMIFSHFMGQGEATSGFYQMEDGVARLINCLRSWPDYSQEEYAELYEIDGFSVSEEEFSAKWEELYGSWEYVLIGYEDGIPLEEETLLTALEQAIEKLSLEDASE